MLKVLLISNHSSGDVKHFKQLLLRRHRLLCRINAAAPSSAIRNFSTIIVIVCDPHIPAKHVMDKLHKKITMSPLGWHCAIFLFLLLIPPLINNVVIGQFGQAPQDPKFDILLDTSTLWHRHQCADFEN
jgi:hypothetical protein